RTRHTRYRPTDRRERAGTGKRKSESSARGGPSTASCEGLAWLDLNPTGPCVDRRSLDDPAARLVRRRVLLPFRTGNIGFLPPPIKAPCSRATPPAPRCTGPTHVR